MMPRIERGVNSMHCHRNAAVMPRPPDKARPHRIERHIAQRRGEMRLVHDHGAEAALPKVAGALATRVNDAGIATMHGGKRAARPVGIGRHQNEMHMVGHQAPGPHRDVRGARMLAEQVAIERIVGVGEKRPRAAVAALGHVMRQAGNDDAREPGHML